VTRPILEVHGRRRGRASGCSTLSCVLIVVSPEAWPACLFACTALALDCHEVWYAGALGRWATRARDLYPSASWLPLARVPSASLQSSAFPLPWPCVVQAPDLSMLPEEWFAARPIFFVGIDHRVAFRVTLTHAATGGVTDTSWVFSSNRPFTSFDALGFQAAAHCLRHVGSKAARVAAPKVVSATEASMQRLQWNRPVTIAHVRGPAGCESVFSPTGWVVRKLTLEELMAVFDVPSMARPEVIDSDGEGVLRLPFLTLPPLKLLQAALQCWSAADTGTVQVSSPVEVPPPQLAQLPDNMYGAPTGPEGNRVEFQMSTKSDDAEAFVEQWNERVYQPFAWVTLTRQRFADKYPDKCPLDVLRGFCLRRWCKNVRRCFIGYLRREYRPDWSLQLARNHPDLQAGRSGITHACGADWWEWRQGSTLFFWRWPPARRREARDGHPIWVKGTLPNYRRPQHKEKDEVVHSQIQRKLANVRSKGYITKGTVSSLTGYFAVLKGPNDVRMVYNATKSGLNAALWVPFFTLPSAETLLDLLSSTSWMADLDMGEMFLNFPLDIKIRPYCGIDLKPFAEELGSMFWEHWARCMMGMMPSPYICVKEALLADEVAKGDPNDLNNPFQWASVTLNLPGMTSYDPRQPWVYRMRLDQQMAGDVATYVDDIRRWVAHKRSAGE
jgi:hypothetical protein